MPFVFHSSEPAFECSSIDGEREALDALEAAANAFRDDNTTLVMRAEPKLRTPPRATRTMESTLPSVIVAADAMRLPALSVSAPTVVRVIAVRRRGPNVALWLLAAAVAVFAIKGVPVVGAAFDNAFGALEGSRTSAR